MSSFCRSENAIGFGINRGRHCHRQRLSGAGETSGALLAGVRSSRESADHSGRGPASRGRAVLHPVCDHAAGLAGLCAGRPRAPGQALRRCDGGVAQRVTPLLSRTHAGICDCGGDSSSGPAAPFDSPVHQRGKKNSGFLNSSINLCFFCAFVDLIFILFFLFIQYLLF